MKSAPTDQDILKNLKKFYPYEVNVVVQAKAGWRCSGCGDLMEKGKDIFVCADIYGKTKFCRDSCWMEFS